MFVASSLFRLPCSRTGSDFGMVLQGTCPYSTSADGTARQEFCGIVESMGKAVKNLQKGDRVVASFQIACGEVRHPLTSVDIRLGL
jgi:threonine dehydrogenase-like Zn-dependent dehydrogenase